MKPVKPSRRRFLKTAGAALTFPTIIPSSVLGRDGTVAPSNRMTLGLIGTGGRMGGVWAAFAATKQVQGVAVCDVWAYWNPAV